jgi:hypothetical protein
MAMSANAARLKRTIEELLANQRDDLRLRDHLEGVRRDEALPGLTWYWGPELYRRNRVVFREFILAHFSDIEREGPRAWRRIPWREHAAQLDAWLSQTRLNRDTWLTRRLLRWKLAGRDWRVDDQAWCRTLLREYQAAQGPAAQGIVLDEFDDWFQLDESTAISLFETNRASSKFILRHLPTRYSFLGGEKREMWRRLIEEAGKANDHELATTLYRRQVDVKEWQHDVERLAEEVMNPEKLNDELLQRHPEGWALKLGDGALSLLKLRGRAVMPYIRQKLDTIIGGYYGSPAKPFLELATQEGWWDLWASVVRTASDPKIFNEETSRLLDDRQLEDATRVERLRALAGVSQEWNWPGIGFAQVHSLEDEIATRLYRRYPKLVHGPFKPNIVPTWWQGGPRLLAAAQESGDDELVDLLASRYVTRAASVWMGQRKQQDAILETAARLAVSYQTMRDRDDAKFARRAAIVLTQVPAFVIYNYDHLLRTNDLARLLFVRSFEAFLAVPEAVRDLIEGSEIHVQMLGYRVLAQDDDRARKLAALCLDILQGTLLRPLHRKTRLAAFAALANAARANAAAAERVLRRAREALRLPDTRYPKEQLVGLMARILHDRPELRGPREHPVVFGLQEAIA